ASFWLLQPVRPSAFVVCHRASCLKRQTPCCSECAGVLSELRKFYRALQVYPLTVHHPFHRQAFVCRACLLRRLGQYALPRSSFHSPLPGPEFSGRLRRLRCPTQKSTLLLLFLTDFPGSQSFE